MASSQETPIVKLDGGPISSSVNDRLRRVHVSLATGTVGHAELHIENTDVIGGRSGTVDDQFSIGASLDIEVMVDDQTSSVFSGTITSIGVRMDNRRQDLVIEALDGSRKLGQSISTKSYLNTKVSDVVSEIASEAGLTAEVETTSEVFDHHQRFDTPHQLLDRLVFEYGFEWFVDGKKLVVRHRGSPAPIELNYPDQLAEFAGRTSGTELPKSVEVRGWDSANKQSIVATRKLADTTTDYPTAPIAATGGPLRGDSDSVASTFRPRVSSQSEAQAIADGLANRLNAMRVSGHGECGKVMPSLKPGGQVNLSGIGTQWAGNYHVAAVDHVWGRDQNFITRFSVGPIDHSTVTDLLGGGGLTGAQRLATGVSIGIVTANNDDEGLGRVKVKIPNLSDDSESWWARVISPGAGGGRGQLIVPEIDDEVAVAFENGDLQRPYILGGLWNAKDKPPPGMPDVVKSGKVMSRSLTSRSGNYVMLHDETEKERYIEIKTADTKSWVKISEDGITVHADAMPITIENKKSSVKMTDAGAVTVTAGGDLTLDAKMNNIVIKGNNITLTAKGELKTNSTSTAINADMAIKLAAKLNAEIKGLMVKLN